MIEVKNFYLTNKVNNHKLIHDFDRFVKNQKDGIYSRYAVDEYLLISDSISELTNILNSHPQGTIQKKDKIYFSKDSQYPALLLSRLVSQYNVDISRTITESKATKFVFNANPISRYEHSYRYSTVDSIHLTAADTLGNRIICIIPNTTDKSRLSFMKSSLEKIYKLTFYFAVSIRNHETVELYINHVSDAVDTRVLTKYVNTFIPEATDSEIESVFGFLKSSDASIRNTGITLFSTMNVGSKLYDVIRRACELRQYNGWAVPSSTSCNSSWSYFFQCIDCTSDEICTDFNSKQSYFLRKIMQNPIYTGDMESIKKEIKAQLLKRLASGNEFKTLREDLKLINCEIVIHDKNGETTPGN